MRAQINAVRIAARLDVDVDRVYAALDYSPGPTIRSQVVPVVAKAIPIAFICFPVHHRGVFTAWIVGAFAAVIGLISYRIPVGIRDGFPAGPDPYGK